MKDTNGFWYIDYASNGFGAWDWSWGGYGGPDATPVPADYDGDGKTDIAIKGVNTWNIDYASTTFGSWDVQRNSVSYGDATAVAVPADYDGDGKADLAVKTNTGAWSLDYSANGFGKPCSGFACVRPIWDITYQGYGDGSAIPVPADYDNDHKADLSVYTSNGDWYVDYASPSFGAWNNWPSGALTLHGYGGSFASAVPGDYDHDGKTDLAAKDNSTGYWRIDFAANGFTGWDSPNPIDTVNRTLEDTNRPFIASTTVYDDSGTAIAGDKAPTQQPLIIGKRYVVDVVVTPSGNNSSTVCASLHDGDDCSNPSTSGLHGVCKSGVCRNVASVELNPELGVPDSLRVRQPTGSTYAPLTPIACTTSSQCIDPTNPGYSSYDCNNSVGIGRCNVHRRHAFTCTQSGNFPLGFLLKDRPFEGQPSGYNPSYGIRVVCSSPQAGISGTVTMRNQDVNSRVYKAGPPIGGATISIQPIGVTVNTDASGHWSYYSSSLTGPLTITISGPNCPGALCKFSDVNALNVIVPAAGFVLDASLEETFLQISSKGLSYKTYVDYSRGRTIFHVIKISSSGSADVSVGQSSVHQYDGVCTTISTSNNLSCDNPANSPTATCPEFDTLASSASAANVLAAINGVWWDPCTGFAQGYIHPSSALLRPEVWCDQGSPRYPATSSANCVGGEVYYAEGGATCTDNANCPGSFCKPNRTCAVSLMPQGTVPLIGVSGSGASKSFAMYESHQNFLESPSSQWTQSLREYVWSPNVLTAAFQIGNPPVLRNGVIVDAGNYSWSSVATYDFVYGATAVGIGVDGMYFVVSDAEGIQGGNGSSANQMGHLFKDFLGVNNATLLDSGLSTQMYLAGSGNVAQGGNIPPGFRRVNTLTGEDGQIQLNPATETFSSRGFEGWGQSGSVANYIYAR